MSIIFSRTCENEAFYFPLILASNIKMLSFPSSFTFVDIITRHGTLIGKATIRKREIAGIERIGAMNK